MTNKGAQRRASLVDAAVELLSESGWPGVTHRAVATRAEANPGLVHYYFAGSAGLRLAVAERAAELSIGQVTDHLLRADDEEQLLAGVEELLTRTTRGADAARLTTELVSAAFTDPAVGEVLATAMRTARERVAAWLATHRPTASPEATQGAAALLLAAVDGAVLHRLLDPELPPQGIAAAIAPLVSTDDEGGAP